MTGGSACRSTSRPIVAPSARAYCAVQGEHDRFSAPAAAAHDSVNQSRRCTDPPRGYRPGSSPRSSVRATSTVVPMRPSGLMSTSHPSATHHQTPGHDGHPRRAGGRDEHRVGREQPGQPPQPDQGGQREGQHGLDQLRADRRRARRPAPRPRRSARTRRDDGPGPRSVGTRRRPRRSRSGTVPAARSPAARRPGSRRRTRRSRRAGPPRRRPALRSTAPPPTRRSGSGRRRARTPRRDARAARAARPGRPCRTRGSGWRPRARAAGPARPGACR